MADSATRVVDDDCGYTSPTFQAPRRRPRMSSMNSTVALAYELLTASYVIEHDEQKEREWTETAEKAGVRYVRGNYLHFMVAEPTLGGEASLAENHFVHALRCADSADNDMNPTSAANKRSRARRLFDQAGEAYFDLRSTIPTEEIGCAKLQKMALMSAVAAYYRAENWPKCFEVLSTAEASIRAVLDNPREKDDAKKALQQIIETRRDLAFKLFRIPQAIADSRALYDLDPKGPLAAGYLRGAADMAGYNGDFNLAVELDKQFVARYAKDPKQKSNVDKLAWRIQQDYANKGDVPGQLQALKIYIETYSVDTTMLKSVIRALLLVGELRMQRHELAAAQEAYRYVLVLHEQLRIQDGVVKDMAPAIQAELQLLQPMIDAFLRKTVHVDLQLPPKKRFAALTKQLQALVTEVRNLGPVCDATVAERGEQALAQAMVQKAKLCLHLADIVAHAPVPGDFTPDERSQIEATLQSVAELAGQQGQKVLEDALRALQAKSLPTELVDVALHNLDPHAFPLVRQPRSIPQDLSPELPLPLAWTPTLDDNLVQLRAKMVAEVQKQPTLARWFDLALLDLQLHRLDDADKEAILASNLAPDNSKPVVLQSILLLRRGKTVEALTVVDHGLQKRPDDGMLLNAKARVLTASGMFGQALEIARHSLELDPDSPEAELQIGQAYWAMKHEGLARLALERAYSLYTGEYEPPPGTPAQGPTRKAYEVRKARSFGILKGTGAELLDRDAGLARIWELYGQMALSRGHFAEAGEHFLNATQLRSNAPDSWRNLGIARIQAGQNAQAIQALQHALSLEPESVATLLNLGNAWIASQQADRVVNARVAYERATALAPGNATAWYDLGLLHVQEQLPGMTAEARLVKAIEYLDKSLNLQTDPLVADAKMDAVRQLQRLGRHPPK